MKDILKYFVYNTKTGLLHWAVDKQRVRKGDVAGYTTSQGYIYVQVDGKLYPSHRLVYLMFNDVDIGENHIDHIDGNKTNNRIENLRLVSPAINNRNKPMTSRNKSGEMGVSWHKGLGRWRVQLNTDSGKTHLGYFDDIESAVKVRDVAYKKHGYTTGHGRCVII